uniref:Gustatory receptor n=2 Tax=Tetranychus urticae TaxID=32264 RepID=T1L287_TETUR
MIEMIRKLKLSNLRRYLKRFFYKLIGRTGESDIETRQALARFDYLNQLFLVSLCGGQKQEYDKPIPRKVWIANWIARISVIYTFTRVSLFMCYQGNDKIDLYLANLISEDVTPSKTSMLALTNITIFILFALREYIHYIERSGYLTSLRSFVDIRIHGVTYEPLKLNERCSRIFSKICHILMINGIRSLILLCVWATSLTIMLRLYFSATYATKERIFFMIFHIPIAIVALITVCSSLLSIGFNLWALLAFQIAHIDSIIDQIKYLFSKLPLSQPELRHVNEQMISVLNDNDQTNRQINYLLLYLDGLIAIEADIMLLFTLVYKLFSDFISKLVSFSGILTHFFLVSGTYWASRYHVLSIHGYYTKLVLNLKATCPAKFKALEVQDRIKRNETGISIGDFATFTARFSLIFILENINFIMLLACNINSLLYPS